MELCLPTHLLDRDRNAKRAFFQSKLLHYFSRLNPAQATAIGHRPEQMFKRCVFETSVDGDDDDCRRLMSGETSFFHPVYGVCHTFNHRRGDGKGRPERRVYLNGPFYGLKLEIDIESSYYLRNGLTEQEGVLVLIHPSHALPDISRSAFAMQPHTASSISLSFAQIRRQAAPYVSNCTDSWDGTSLRGLVKDDGDIRYQSTLCQSFCLHDLVRSRCNCSMTEVTDAHSVHDGVPYCDLLNGADNGCVSAIVAEIDGDDDGDKGSINGGGGWQGRRRDLCVCPPQCNEVRYEGHISSSRWPAKHFWLELASEHGLVYRNSTTFVVAASPLDQTEEDEVTKQVREQVEGNFLQLQVYFESKTMELIVEEPKYDFSSFLASLGGSVSLYLGMSFIAIFELFEIVVRVAIILVRRGRCREKVKISSSSS